jgi:hypothetical protein
MLAIRSQEPAMRLNRVGKGILLLIWFLFVLCGVALYASLTGKL